MAELNEKLIDLEEVNRALELAVDKLKGDEVDNEYRRFLPSQLLLAGVDLEELGSYDEVYLDWKEKKESVEKLSSMVEVLDKCLQQMNPAPDGEPAASAPGETPTSSSLIKNLVERISQLESELCSSQASNESLAQQLEETSEKLAAEVSRSTELEQELSRCQQLIQELEDSLYSERATQRAAINDAVELEIEKYNREIEQLGAMYDNNERILTNNIKLVEESYAEKIEMLGRDKERVLEVLQELKHEVDDITRALEHERTHSRELEGEVDRLTTILDQESEKNEITEQTYN